MPRIASDGLASLLCPWAATIQLSKQNEQGLMEYFRVANWQTLQHYKDRNPPWIKLHNSLLDDYAFISLPDTAKAHFLAIMMLASRTENKIPVDAAFIKARIGANTKVDIIPLIEAGFLEYLESNQSDNDDASNMLQTPAQSAIPEQSRAEQSRGETEQSILMFERFWNIYPGPRAKTKREDSLKTWLKIDHTIYQTIIDHVTERPLSDPKWIENDGEFIPGPAPFLKGKRWQDSWKSDPLQQHSETTRHNIRVMQDTKLS